MCKNQDELVAIIDEIAGAAVSMHQGAQSYDSFIKARDRGVCKINEHFDYRNKLVRGIQELREMI